MRAQLELSQVRQEIDRRLQEKEEEFENTRKNHQRALDSMQASLEAESRGKAEALRMKKKLESDINELEIALDHSNKANAEAQKNIKKYQQTLKELQAAYEEEQRARDEARDDPAAVVRGGGEGLMLHRGASLYRAGRGEDLLKLKTHDDAEARVIAHVPGKGKHAGRLGALMVETPEGRRFALGTGFTDAQRADPPPVGSWVSYRFRGLHEGSGLPRFASFMRVRADEARFRPGR